MQTWDINTDRQGFARLRWVAVVAFTVFFMVAPSLVRVGSRTWCSGLCPNMQDPGHSTSPFQVQQVKLYQEVKHHQGTVGLVARDQR